MRLWLLLLAYLFFWGATLLRLAGNGLSALGGLVAFTVVLSVALSILSALVFLSATAADAAGSFITYLARCARIGSCTVSSRDPHLLPLWWVACIT